VRITLTSDLNVHVRLSGDMVRGNQNQCMCSFPLDIVRKPISIAEGQIKFNCTLNNIYCGEIQILKVTICNFSKKKKPLNSNIGFEIS
jgi:hypothetical protein